MSTGSTYVPHSQTASMSHYPQQYPTHATGSYPSAMGYHGYPYGSTTSAYSTGQPMSVTSSLLPPPLGTSAPAHHTYHPHTSYAAGGHHQDHIFDTSGQVQPPNTKQPKITATLWEDEGTLCFQVEAKGVTVARREDNSYINGTKLLNVAGMTRGRRDGILKSEKLRNVVKIGPMHLKGVWIPFEKALEFANREKITDLLFPIFVHNISHMMVMHGQSGDGMPRLDQARLRARAAKEIPPGSHLPSQGGPHSLSTIAQVAGGRPGMERSHTFPTPPTSASSVIGAQNNSYDWNGTNMPGTVQSSAPLAIDTTLSNSRSLPNTPASTPPGNTIQSMQTYQGHTTINPYSMQQSMPRYTQPSQYIKSEMGPPAKGTGSIGEGDQSEIKHDPYNQTTGDATGQTQDDAYSRGQYMTQTNGIVDSTIPSPEQIYASPHQTTSGRVTPRTSIHSQQWAGYSTPPRSDAVYAPTSASATNGTNAYSTGGYNSSLGGAKRAREDDDLDRSSINSDIDPMKRRRGDTNSSISSLPTYDPNRLNQAGNTIIPRIR